MRAAALALLSLAFVGEAVAQEQQRFISCPIFRDVDAGRKSGCWLAEDPATGQRFDIGSGPTKPDWNHEVLVEGVVSSKPDACGGVVLDPVRVSVLEGACTRHALPAEGHKGRAFVLPPRNVRPAAEPRAKPQPPFTPTSFFLLFDWNTDFIVYQLDDFLFDQAVAHIKGVNPSKIIVTGYAATTPAKVSGRLMIERGDIAKQRAEEITEALKRMGVPAAIIETKWKNAAEPTEAPGADGLKEASRRRVEIRVIP
jgi:outer membrane protein OmpA-like peptidoglycan-associated protein